MIFECESCDYVTSRKNNWDRHVTTHKHKTATEGHKTAAENEQDHKMKLCCSICNKFYKHRKGLWKHNQTYHSTTDQTICGQDVAVTQEMYIDLLKEKNEILQKHVETLKKNTELQSQIIEIAKERTVINHHTTNNNNQFNLNVYLNETCKDALNYSEFLKSIVLGQKDLQLVVNNGYIQGHSLLIKEHFDKLEVHERPIQCSDPKRGITHIKNDDVWRLDDENMTHIRKLTDYVTYKTMQQYCIWSKENPPPVLENEVNERDIDDEDADESIQNYRRAKEKHMELHLHVMKQVNGMGNEMERNNTEICKNVIKMVTINKDKERENKRIK